MSTHVLKHFGQAMEALYIHLPLPLVKHRIRIKNECTGLRGQLAHLSSTITTSIFEDRQVLRQLLFPISSKLI